MTDSIKATAVREQQSDFASAIAQQLRLARKKRRMTQSDVAARTAGVISKAALANYETGHRSLRVEIFWAIARALEEDPGALIRAAERSFGFGSDADDGPITVDAEAVLRSEDERLAPVRRWFAMRLHAGGARLAVRTVVLDHVALGALAQLMGTSEAECRRVLATVSIGRQPGEVAVGGRSPAANVGGQTARTA